MTQPTRLRISPLARIDRPALVEMLSNEIEFPADAVGFYRYPRPPYEDLVAWLDNQAVGMLTGHLRTTFIDNHAFDEFDLPVGPHTFISRIFVPRHARRQHIGRSLVGALAETANRHGSTFIAGSIDRSSDARGRREFFASVGFTITPADQFGAPIELVISQTIDR